MSLYSLSDGQRDRTSKACRCCGHPLDGVRLDLGALPACNRFTVDAPVRETRPLIVGQCASCGLVQLADDTPVDFIRPRVSWIRYNEPDGNLADMCDRIQGGAGCRAIGVGPFDKPLLDSLASRGFATRLLNLLPAIGTASDGYPYLETVQQALRPETLAGAAGHADIVVCRYLLEHAHDPIAALQGLRALASPQGRILVEVPDSKKFLRRRDYSFIWEEHICYFTEATLRMLVANAGLSVESITRYEGVLEDALVAILRPEPGASDAAPHPDAAGSDFHDYASAFPRAKAACHARLGALTTGDRRVALIGIGHQAIMFVNAMQLGHHIAVMVDDDPNKRDCFVPGTETRIVPLTAILHDPTISACILAVHPRVEARIRDRLTPLDARAVGIYALSRGGGSATLLDGET
jgi:hypothetical protein